jgi:P-type conjugative transfer protein TrbJ
MMKRRILQWLSAAMLVIGTTRAGQAQVAVHDATNLIQTTSTAIATARMVQGMIQQIQLMRQTLESIDPRSFTGLETLLMQGQMDYRTLTNDVNALSFVLTDVSRSFDRIFPKDKTAWQSVRYSDYDNYYTRWNGEITASAQISARAQSAMSLVENNNRAVAAILSQSAAAAGEIRQLQLINQQLALIHSRLGDLVQNIASMGRVMAEMAASSAGEKLLRRQAKQRRLDGYTNRGKPPSTLTRLP